MFAELNKSNFTTINWGVDTKEWPYKKCADLEKGKKYKVVGFYLTKNTGFGVGAVAILAAGYILNLPASTVEDVRTIMNTPEMVESVKNGECAIEISSYQSKKYKKECYKVSFVDVK